MQKSEIENLHDLALEADLEMRSYSDTKQVLDRHKISMNEDLPKFAKTVHCIAEYACDPKKILAEFNDIQFLARKRQALKIATEEMQERVAKLGQDDSFLRHEIDLHSENLSLYNELANIGFGSNELRKLLDTILSITNSNDINYWLAVNKFFEDIETQCNTKLGFESQIEDLDLEIQKLNEEREKGLQRLKAQPLVGPIIVGLLRLGLSEDDISKVAETCHNNLSTKTYSAEDLRKGITNTIQSIMMNIMTSTMLATSLIQTTSNDNITKTHKVQNDLSLTFHEIYGGENGQIVSVR
jgi:hypothetical protein